MELCRLLQLLGELTRWFGGSRRGDGMTKNTFAFSFFFWAWFVMHLCMFLRGSVRFFGKWNVQVCLFGSTGWGVFIGVVCGGSRRGLPYGWHQPFGGDRGVLASSPSIFMFSVSVSWRLAGSPACHRTKFMVFIPRRSVFGVDCLAPGIRGCVVSSGVGLCRSC